MGAKFVALTILALGVSLAAAYTAWVGILVFVSFWALIGTGTLREALFNGDKRLLNMKPLQTLKVFGKAAFYGPFTWVKVMSKL
ncbi:MAG: hypothetical protein HY457_02050 [Parcubacteria group bacterium]|nr:hypothetical protein [Parcubacteria group bacterium]